MKQVDNRAHPFDAYYFAHGCGRPYQRDEEWLKFFGTIAERIVSGIQPSMVLDTGCAMGFLVEALRERGVEAFGIDISEYAIENVVQDIRPYCWVGSVTEAFPKRYDLIVCIEVLEHMKPPEAERALENICRHTDDVLFSSTPFDYKEATHFNVQPPEHWAELFARQGFLRDVDYDASYINAWATRFRRNNEPTARVVRNYERRFWLLWKEVVDLRELTSEMRDQLAVNEESIKTLSTQAKQVPILMERLIENERCLAEVFNSRSWQLVVWIRKVFNFLVPPGSLRERILSWLGTAFDKKDIK